MSRLIAALIICAMFAGIGWSIGYRAGADATINQIRQGLTPRTAEITGTGMFLDNLKK